MRVNLNSSINLKAETCISRKNANAKNVQLAAAVEWCRENNVRGHTVIQSGQFPLVKECETINSRLYKKVVNGRERDSIVPSLQKMKRILLFLISKIRIELFRVLTDLM